MVASVINNLHKRMFTTVSSHESRMASTPSHQAAYETLLEELKVLEPDQWPTGKHIGFGEIEIENLCKRFKLNVVRIKYGYGDFLENHTRIPNSLIS